MLNERYKTTISGWFHNFDINIVKCGIQAGSTGGATFSRCYFHFCKPKNIVGKQTCVITEQIRIDKKIPIPSQPAAGEGVVVAIVVVDEGEGVVVVFGGEAEGVFGEDVAVGDAGGAEGAGDGAEGCVVVMRGDAVLRGVVEDLRDVLVAVVRIEEVEAPVLGTHGQRPRGDRLRGIPHKLRPHGVLLHGIQPLDAEVAVVDETLLLGHGIALAFPHPHAATQTVEGHLDDGLALHPTDGSVLGVVGDLGVARFGKTPEKCQHKLLCII